ncbi:hypothetical protein F4779DRAFT_284432 [Xylariaceae sp. FL0662B]|nr:hypothetical protein F4779DRAFT_284432 [Xylariaceae sp. FL0662B]
MAGNHGLRNLYEDGDQRNFQGSSIETEQRHHIKKAEGYMPKDRNKAMNKMLDEDIRDRINERYKTDPTYAATMHGNKPSKGAKVDAELRQEEEEMLKRKKGRSVSLPAEKSGEMKAPE